ncbi:hypothetical protein BGZ49_010092 [Haplosporangium sp. Z 27]|nr:hypothetical protein BGZ49_010092 [Haplosporangium sp. Z 27]
MTISCFGFGASSFKEQSVVIPNDALRMQFAGWTSFVIENAQGQIEICGDYSPEEASLVKTIGCGFVESTGSLLPDLEAKETVAIPLRFFGLESLQGYLSQDGDVIGLYQDTSLPTTKGELFRKPHLYYRNAKDVAACGSSTDNLTVVIDRLTQELHQWTKSDPTPRPVVQKTTQAQKSMDSNVKFDKIWAGEAHILSLATDGTLYSWGSGRHGQLGHGDLRSVSTPKPIESLQGIRIVEAACGASFSVAISDTGDAYSFGLNDRGQLGIGKHVLLKNNEERRNTSYPQLIDFYDEDQDEIIDVNVTRVSCGRAHVVVLDDLGQAWSCGWGKYGQLSQKSLYKPTAITKTLGASGELDQFLFKKVFKETTKPWDGVVCGHWSTSLWIK